MIWTNLWSWIEKNRFIVLCPVIAGVVWMVAVGCTPITDSPFNPGKPVTATELEQEYLLWQKQNEIIVAKFEMAGKDLQQQYENQQKFMEVITTLASGSVADWPGLVQLLLGSGVVGLLADNIRKNGVIGGLKRNA
jgi:hypothetical protein